MYNEISTYLDARFAEINNSISGTANDWLKVSLLGEKPESNKLNSYRLLLEEDGRAFDYDAPAFDVTANVELSFIIPNGDVTKYQSLIDTYIHSLVKHISNNASYEYSSAWSMNVIECSAGNLGDIQDGELNVELTLVIRVIDSVTINTNAPSAPTLTAPTDGSTSGTVDQSFNWTGTADSWDIIIYNGSNTVIYQTGLAVSSYTVPLDSVLTNGQSYSWKVRGWNAGGYGEWSSLYSFTVNDDPSAQVPTLIEPLASTETSLTVTFLWTLSTNSTSYDIQIASDSGFSSLLVDTNVSKTSYEYTFNADGTYYWRVRGENSLGNSAWASSSVIVDAPIPDYTTGLVRRWNANELLTSNASGISAWVDTVGSLSAGQTTDANKPVLVTNFVNGKNAVYFNNDNHYLTFTPETWSNFTVFVVCNPTSFTSGDANVMIGGTAGDIYSGLRVLNGGLGLGNGSAFRDKPYDSGDTGWAIWVFQPTKVFKNKVEVASYRGTGTISSITVGTIGKRSSSLYPYKGYMGEIREYTSVLNQTQIDAVSDYLNSIYAIY